MKMEKLTENKIRVIIHSEELGLNNLNLHSIMTKSIETQAIFSDILKKAEKELDFCTDGCKLLIEGFSSLEDIFVFTITKYLPDSDSKKRKLIAKRKSFDKNQKHVVCRFENFDVFCEFCNAFHDVHNFESKKLAKNIALYQWKDSYYLIFRNMNTKYEKMDLFYAKLSEFAQLLSFSEHFECKLLEHGNVVIKKNAIDVGIQFFTNP